MFFQAVVTAACFMPAASAETGKIPDGFEGFKLGMTLEEVERKLGDSNFTYNRTVDSGVPNALKEGPPMSLQSELARALKYTTPLSLTAPKLGGSDFTKFYFTSGVKPEKLCVINVRYGPAHWQNYSSIVEEEAGKFLACRKESEEGFMKKSLNDSAVWENADYIYKITRATEQNHFSLYGRQKMRTAENSYLEILFVDKRLFEEELGSYR